MLLLDTCSLLWLVSDQARLSEPAREAIAKHAGETFVSAISAFEIGVKHRKKKLELPLPVDEWFPAAVSHHGLRSCPITHTVAARSTLLPPIHADPADRMIVATALELGLTVLTPDAKIASYPEIAVLW